MALLIGIDEAGFGPLLGPLAVTATAWRVTPDNLTRCLWESLRETCAKEVSRRDGRLPILDSKKLHRGDDLTPLERTALVMMAVSGATPDSWRSLLDLVNPGAGQQLRTYPWYAQGDQPIPTSGDTGDIGTRANAIRRNLREQSIEFLGAFSEVVFEGQYNRMVRSTRNKSSVLITQVMRVLRRALQAGDEPTARIVIDRLGGRMHYREMLSLEFEGYEVVILEEVPERSAYRLTRGANQFDIEFLAEGEQRHLPIALASVFSKYLRELSMLVFNSFWSNQDPTLRATAGYYTDAQRWLSDAAPLIDRLKVDRTLLIRER